MSNHFPICIVGGGAGGISLAARLSHLGYQKEIVIIEPSDFHYYQPLWTLSGAGIVKKEKTKKPQAQVIPKGVKWIKDRAIEFEPEKNAIHTIRMGKVTYDVLIVALGLILNYDEIEGLEDHLGRDGICSIYRYDQVDHTAKMIQNLRSGQAIFTMPPLPIKCAGAPQKIMYLADDIWRRNGYRSKIEVSYIASTTSIFGIPTFAEVLNEVIERKGIKTLFQHQLVKVDAKKKLAWFNQLNGDGNKIEVPYDLLHIVPPMSAPLCIKNSSLAAQEGAHKGWLEVDPFTLQHLKFPNIFGIGDVTGIPNSKTGAAVRKQAPVLAGNIDAYLKGLVFPLRYDGYASCPLITGIGKVVLAEFGYDGKLMPTFPLNPAKERKMYWYLKKDLLPIFYWQGMLKGKA